MLRRKWRRAAYAGIVLCGFAILATEAQAVTISTVPVGNAGNVANTILEGTPSAATLGAVNYNYRIGTFEVTNAEYAEFLNAKAASDPLRLYSTNMDISARGGITRSGSDGSYIYAVKPNMGNKPVNLVNWYDAVRFANWLHNGQGAGDTETGAYTLLGGTPTPSNGLEVTRNPGAIWFLPSTDEWYKAAFHQPAAQGGDSDDYWHYPTASNIEPTMALANSIGDICNAAANVANYFDGADWNGQNGNVTTVGSAGPQSQSFYGTSDQAGNVREWIETLFVGTGFSGRCSRGGSWNESPIYLRELAGSGATAPEYHRNYWGFRVATVAIVPEPSTFALAALGIVGIVLRRKWRRAAYVGLVCCGLTILATEAQAVTMSTVPVGNAGNGGELSGAGAGGFGPDAIVGGVAYDYRIGTTEVTNAQYAAFLNAKAASDPLSLYNTNMGSNVRGGITQSGVSGSFTYTTKTDMGNKPVNFINWYDSIRFANWLHNNQGNGHTEVGAYTLEGGTPTPSNGLSITRNAGARWFLPSEDEWYKAAYHQPAAQGGDSDSYWLYPTANNSEPTLATANSVGDISNPGTNVANYSAGADWNSTNGNVTTVGSAGPSSDSFYGTADQGGNLFEWNEAVISDSFRGLRGGGFFSQFAVSLQSSRRNFLSPSDGADAVGFRVATVPEPSTFGLAALGIVGIVLRRKWRRAGLCRARVLRHGNSHYRSPSSHNSHRASR